MSSTPCTTSAARSSGVLRHTQSNPEQTGTEDLWNAGRRDACPSGPTAEKDTANIVVGLTDVNKHLKSICNQVPPPPSGCSVTPVTQPPAPRSSSAILGVWGLLAGLMLDPHAAGHETAPQAGDGHHDVGVGDRPGHRLHRPHAGDQPALGRTAHRLAAPARDARRHAGRHRRPGRPRSTRSWPARRTIESNSKEIEGKVTSAPATPPPRSTARSRASGRASPSILATLRATQAAAGEINTSTRGINSAVAALLPVTKDIDSGIGTANRGIAEAADLRRCHPGRHRQHPGRAARRAEAHPVDRLRLGLRHLFGLLGPGRGLQSVTDRLTLGQLRVNSFGLEM